MLQDLRHAGRSLLKSPAYTAIAVMVVAIGIGANAAIFSFVDGMLLRPLPYPHADRLYVPISLNPSRGSTRSNVTFADYEDWRRDTEVFAAVAIANPTTVDLTGTVEPERIESLVVTEDYFALTAVKPLAGRVLQAADHAASAPRVAVLSYSLWQRRFAGAADAVGHEVRIGGVPTTVVGVLPPRATFPEDRELILPMRTSLLNADVRTRRDNMIFQGITRLADGVTREQADARLRAIAARLEKEFPESRKGWSNRLLPLREYLIEPELEIALYVLLAAVVAVLLIGCANLASLALVRGTGRRREFGVRLALGASRVRLIRQLLAESLLVAATGGTLGVLLATVMVDGLRSAVPSEAPFLDQVAVDARVVAAAAGMSLMTAVLVGILPGLLTSAVGVVDALKEGAHNVSPARHASRLRNALVVCEIAAAVVLLVMAGLLVRSLTRLTTASPGADLDRVLAGRLTLPGARYPQAEARARFVRELTTRLAGEAGVQAAAITTFLPVGGGGFGLGRVFLAEGWPEPPAGPDVPGMWTVVSTDYFQTLGIPLVQGRAFDERDTASSTPVIIVSATFARRAFGDQSPLGRRIRSWRDENLYREIVGVVSDVPFERLSDPTRSIAYIPYPQDSWGLLVVAVRASTGPPEALAGTLRKTVAALDPDLALARVGTMSLFARDSIARERVSTTLMAGLAVSALLLAALGIYGVMSSSVAESRREMGVRVALGAAPRDLYRLMLGRGLGLTALGLAIGGLLATAASQALRSLLYETSALDPAIFTGMVLILAATAFVACFLPARRVASADATSALRSD